MKKPKLLFAPRVSWKTPSEEGYHNGGICARWPEAMAEARRLAAKIREGIPDTLEVSVVEIPANEDAPLVIVRVEVMNEIDARLRQR